MAQRLRIAFAGTPGFAAVSLRALIADATHDIVAVYTQPDRPAGRGRHLASSPVKQFAEEIGLPVYQPRTLRDSAPQAVLRAHNLDLIIVVAYGLMLPQSVLDMPRLGCINVHASLLPRWRGAAPIERAILAGDTETGVTLMQMEAALDCGPILAAASCPIGENDTAGDLHDRIARLGAELLVSTLPALVRSEVRPRPQDEAGASYAAKIDKAETVLDWSQPAVSLARKVRAFNPRWGTTAALGGEIIKIRDAVLIDEVSNYSPGTVVKTSASGIDVATGDKILRIRQLQAAGKRTVSAADFLNARPELVVES